MKALTEQKRRVRDFWNEQPCGTRDNPHPPDSPAYFEWVEQARDTREPFIARFARWPAWRGRRVLEMGVGAGTDFVKFARAGAHVTGVDLSERSAALARTRVRGERRRAQVAISDVENLPFPDATFDFVYSWGVIHHTQDTPAAAREIVRVLRPGGQFAVMIYHRRSLLCLQAYLVYGLGRGRPFRSIDDIAREHLESYGTKVYTRRAAAALFPGIPVTITNVLTPYDVRIGRTRFLPAAVRRLIPDYLGYFLVIEGQKP
jgi:ubiquinone/menaquinone biosynthesis C-methylase UbiE